MKYFLIISIILHLFFFKGLELLDSKKTYILGQKVIEIGYIQKQITNSKSQIPKSNKIFFQKNIITNDLLIKKEKILKESKSVELQQDLNEQEELTGNKLEDKEGSEVVTSGLLISNSISYDYETILWFKEIKNKIEKFKKYPKEAREKNIEGEVLVDISILNNGYVSSINIFKSSGNKSLDEGTIKIIKTAQPFLPPKKINLSKVVVRVPVKFSLK